jgi:hypothetical protein
VLGGAAAAECTGADDGAGAACELNADASACAGVGGDCAYTPAELNNQGGFYSTGSWVPGGTDAEPWYQMDVDPADKDVRGVLMRGHLTEAAWVTAFEAKYLPIGEADTEANWQLQTANLQCVELAAVQPLCSFAEPQNCGLCAGNTDAKTKRATFIGLNAYCTSGGTLSADKLSCDTGEYVDEGGVQAKAIRIYPKSWKDDDEFVDPANCAAGADSCAVGTDPVVGRISMRAALIVYRGTDGSFANAVDNTDAVLTTLPRGNGVYQGEYTAAVAGKFDLVVKYGTAQIGTECVSRHNFLTHPSRRDQVRLIC